MFKTFDDMGALRSSFCLQPACGTSPSHRRTTNRYLFLSGRQTRELHHATNAGLKPRPGLLLELALGIRSADRVVRDTTAGRRLTQGSRLSSVLRGC